MQFASINDVTIHYQLIGAPADRPVIVFANSLGTDFRIWRDVIVRLAGDFAIILYDMRGHGLSDVGQVPYSMEDHATDLAGLLDLLSVKDAVDAALRDAQVDVVDDGAAAVALGQAVHVDQRGGFAHAPFLTTSRPGELPAAGPGAAGAPRPARAGPPP